MQVKVNDKVIFEISDVDFKLLEHDLLDVPGEIERRLQYIIQHKVEQCYKRFKAEWDDKLSKDPDVNSIPTKRDDYVNFIIKLPDYKNREVRELEK